MTQNEIEDLMEKYTKKVMELTEEKEMEEKKYPLLWDYKKSVFLYEEKTTEDPSCFVNPLRFSVNFYKEKRLEVILCRVGNAVYMQVEIPCDFNDFICNLRHELHRYFDILENELFERIKDSGIVKNQKGKCMENQSISSFLKERITTTDVLPVPMTYADFQLSKKKFCMNQRHSFCFEGKQGQLSIEIESIEPFVVSYEFNPDYKDLKLSQKDEQYIKSLLCSVNWVKNDGLIPFQCGQLMAENLDSKFDKMLKLYFKGRAGITREKIVLSGKEFDTINICITAEI